MIALLAFWLFNPVCSGAIPSDAWLTPCFSTCGIHKASTSSNLDILGTSRFTGFPVYCPGQSPGTPEVFFYFGLDGLIFLLALPGMYWEWRERRWVVVWIAGRPDFFTALAYEMAAVYAGPGPSALPGCFDDHEARIPLAPGARSLLGLGFSSAACAASARFLDSLVAIILGMGIFYTMSTYQLVVGNLGWSNINTEVVYITQ